MSILFRADVLNKLLELEKSIDDYDKASLLKELTKWAKTHRRDCKGYHDVEEFYQD